MTKTTIVCNYGIFNFQYTVCYLNLLVTPVYFGRLNALYSHKKTSAVRVRVRGKFCSLTSHTVTKTRLLGPTQTGRDFGFLLSFKFRRFQFFSNFQKHFSNLS